MSSASDNHPIRDRDWWRSQARDLTFFNSAIMPFAWDEKFHDFGRIHAIMCKHLDPAYQKNGKIYLSAHRGSGKTTQLLGFEVWWLTWGIVDKATDSMIYNTATKENCWNMQADVKHTLLSNDFLLWVFPELPQKESEWDDMTKNRIKCRHMKLDFASLETTLVSRHYPNWINDDLENDQNSKSDYSRSELIRTWKYQKAILTKIKKRNVGREIETGTPYHVNGLIWKIRNMEGYSGIEIPCYVNRDKNQGVWYDELYTVEDFEEKRSQMGATIFSAQYLLKPLSEEDALCPESWVTKWDALPDIRWRTMVVDPGGAEPGASDATGVTICDTDENGNLHVVYADEHFLTPIKLCDFIVKLSYDYDVDDPRIEKEKYSIVMADIFRRKYPTFHISFVEHRGRAKGDSRKVLNSRIWRLKQWFESKRIKVGHDQRAFMDQLLTFPQTSTGRDDIIDSLAYHLDIMRVPKRSKKLILPSGREWVPVAEATFDDEYARYIGRKNHGAEVAANDSSW